ncbi:MAG: PD40 domain-containing protein [Chloroflexi bacterium]|nr:PD40 domain-containing protein [Chloroflexota bacterium]
MTSFDRFERNLPDLLEALAAPRRPDYAEDLFTRTAATRQRPGWSVPERWLPMSVLTGRFAAVPRIPWRLGALVALLVVAAIVGLIVAGSGFSRPAPPFGPAANGLIPYTSNGDLYVGDPKTGSTRLLVKGPDTAAMPGFAPDGTRLAFLRVVANSAPQSINIYVIKPDGSDLVLVTQTPLPDADWKQISWTADSRHIGVVHSVDHVSQLDILDVSSTAAPKRLTAAAGLTAFRFRPPGGSEILFRGRLNASGGTDFGLYAMNADGSNVRLLVKQNAPPSQDTLDLTDATYTPDGSRIFFNRWTSTADSGNPGCCQLFVANADGSGERQFVPNPGNAWDGKASVSPDGKLIAFLHGVNDEPGHGIAVIHADGSGKIVYTGPDLGDSSWVWSPDSSRILMYPLSASNSTAYLLDPAGGPYTTVQWRGDNDIDWQRLAP